MSMQELRDRIKAAGLNNADYTGEDNQDQACESGPSKADGALQLLIMFARRWVFLNVWCRYLYRPTMRLLHQFNLHYAPPSPPLSIYGKQDHLCRWCGLRGTTWTYDQQPLKKEDWQ